MKNAEIRQVTRDDAVFLQKIMNDDQVMSVLNEVPTSVDVWADAIIDWGNDLDEEDYIIFDGGIPIGWLGINGLLSESKQAYIKCIALLPAHQGRGIGQCVINRIVENLRLRGFTSLALHTDCSNERAQRCYSRCGFEISEKTVKQVSNGSAVSRYKMERSL